MAASSSYMASTKFSMLGWLGKGNKFSKSNSNSSPFTISAQQQAQVQEQEDMKAQEAAAPGQEKAKQPEGTRLRPVEPQVNVKSKNMSREYGGQWLSSATRHVRIYAAYIDPVTCEFDQSQMDKLTLILDPTNEFVWSSETCNKVYACFQELVDHYEGAPLTEYTLRLIGSDVEHYIRKLLYDGEIKYNMNARVLNFSMGKPRIMFNNNNLDGEVPDAQ
ncbi:NAD(P)H-quinone oxidoreductase subunit M, chloroplastic [Eucalyptus grandis]|uniref:NAD(P)H-quinone oxidoreductase subunit M, chloroplastic n=1 Tax=Eucalyptus grandis TaxID=71139 RepID=UPI00192ECADB|nr:NAD(P)H-quinone oxidoreductase subunit M, chloroplastic [Eucalyptus grandis]